MDVHLREEAPSHGSSSAGGTSMQPPSAAASSVSSASVPVSALEAELDEEGMHVGGRSLIDDQRARGYGFAEDEPTTTGYPLRGSSYTMGPGADVKPSELLPTGAAAPSAGMPSAATHVPLQPRSSYAPNFISQHLSGTGGGSGSGGMGVPLRPASGKARSNSWSYPASAVAPYAYPSSSAASSTGGGAGSGGVMGMPAPRPGRYRSRTSSLSFPSEDAMRQQFLEQQQQQPQQQQQQTPMYLSYPPQPSQPQPQQQRQDQQYSTMFGTTGDGGGFLAAYQQSRPPQTSAPSTPPLPTTPSSFIRRTSLPQTYLHTIPISRSSTPGFTPASTDTALPTALPQTAEVPQKLEIPTHGARALPKEIATHPAIQSITKTHTDSNAVGSEGAGEKEAKAEVKGEEEEETGVLPAEGKFVDISEYLNLPQSKVAKTLGIPSSTLSKRWKEAARARKWPWRTVCKIDKEIMALLHNIPPAVAAKGPEHVPPEIHTRLLTLLKQRQDELKPVIIRLS